MLVLRFDLLLCAKYGGANVMISIKRVDWMMDELIAGGLIRVEAGTGWGARVGKGKIFDVINTYGSQVVDTWAFVVSDVFEYMSMEHTRLYTGRITPEVGDTLFTNLHQPILTLVEDTSGGVHDTLLPACDSMRYERLGHVGYHRSCAENLARVLRNFEFDTGYLPSPLNLFENAPVIQGRIGIQAPLSSVNNYVSFRAERDLVVVFSACPQDLVPTNGADCTPKDVYIRFHS